MLRIWALTSNAEEVEVELFYEDLQDFLELTPKKDVFFIIGDWNAKVGGQETPVVKGKFGLGIRNETGQRLIEFCQENALVIANTLFQQHKRRLYTWTSPNGQHQNQIDYILCSQRWRSSIQSTKARLGRGSDHELLIAKFRLKLKKVGKTTRPFKYDLNQSHMIIQWKWQIDSRYCFWYSAWRTMDGGSWHCTGVRDQDHPHGKETQKRKMSCLGRPYK